LALRLYCLKCTTFGQLILRRITKIVASRCQIVRLKCTKFDFGLGAAPDPATRAYIPPQSPYLLTVFKGPTSKGREEREGKREGRKEKDREGEVTGGQGRGEEWKSASPIPNSWVRH